MGGGELRLGGLGTEVANELGGVLGVSLGPNYGTSRAKGGSRAEIEGVDVAECEGAALGAVGFESVFVGAADLPEDKMGTAAEGAGVGSGHMGTIAHLVRLGQ